jgi:hypothetical protein
MLLGYWPTMTGETFIAGVRTLAELAARDSHRHHPLAPSSAPALGFPPRGLALAVGFVVFEALEEGRKGGRVEPVGCCFPRLPLDLAHSRDVQRGLGGVGLPKNLLSIASRKPRENIGSKFLTLVPRNGWFLCLLENPPGMFLFGPA